MSEVLTIGEAMAVFASTDVDVSLAQARHFTKYLAGAEVNVAVGIARLNHSVEYVTQVGTDPIGEFVQLELAKNDIDHNFISVTDQQTTGLMFKQKVTKGDPATANYRKNSAAANYSPSAIAAINLDGVKIAHITGIFPALSATTQAATQQLFDKLAQHAEITRVFDTNLRPALWDSKETMIDTINHFASQAHIVLPGVSEGEILMGSADPETIADYYLTHSAVTHTVIVKVGSKGAFVKTKAGKKAFVPGFKVAQVIDTVGAGDGFALGVITGLLDELPIEAAVQRGNAIGALAVQAAGDNDGYPTSAELATFIAANSQEILS